MEQILYTCIIIYFTVILVHALTRAGMETTISSTVVRPPEVRYLKVLPAGTYKLSGSCSYLPDDHLNPAIAEGEATYKAIAEVLQQAERYMTFKVEDDHFPRRRTVEATLYLLKFPEQGQPTYQAYLTLPGSREEFERERNRLAKAMIAPF